MRGVHNSAIVWRSPLVGTNLAAAAVWRILFLFGDIIVHDPSSVLSTIVLLLLIILFEYENNKAYRLHIILFEQYLIFIYDVIKDYNIIFKGYKHNIIFNTILLIIYNLLQFCNDQLNYESLT